MDWCALMIKCTIRQGAIIEKVNFVFMLCLKEFQTIKRSYKFESRIQYVVFLE